MRVHVLLGVLALGACEARVEPPAVLIACDRAGGDREEQIALCTTAIASPWLTNQQRAHAFHTRGFAYADLERLDEALADYDRSVALNPNPERASIFFNRGRLHTERGDDAAAVVDFTRAAEVNPDWADPISWRASVRSRLGDHEGALADIDLAMEMNPYERAALMRSRRRILAAAGQSKGTP